jgi:hypothetical protein
VAVDNARQVERQVLDGRGEGHTSRICELGNYCVSR